MALDLRLRASVHSVPSARHHMARWLDALSLPDEVVDDMALAVTELVTNAVEASPDGGEVVVRATYHPPDLCLEVVDEGPGFHLHDPPENPGAEAIRGRGLPIVRALVDLVEVERDGRRTKVTATRRLAPSSA